MSFSLHLSLHRSRHDLWACQVNGTWVQGSGSSVRGKVTVSWRQIYKCKVKALLRSWKYTITNVPMWKSTVNSTHLSINVYLKIKQVLTCFDPVLGHPVTLSNNFYVRKDNLNCRNLHIYIIYMYVYIHIDKHTHMCRHWWRSLLGWQLLILSGQHDKELPAKMGPSSPVPTHVHGLHEIGTCYELLFPINTFEYMNFLTVKTTLAVVNIQIIYSYSLQTYISI